MTKTTIPAAEPAGAEQAADPAPAQATPPAARPKKVLVVDDNPTIVELVRHAVILHGKFDVVVAYDGVQGLEQFYREHPDCVIVDVKMPRMDGYQFVRCIRGDGSSAHTPMIILTAMNEEDDQLTGILSGVDEYMAKPFKPSALCATLERVMQITPEERDQRTERLAAERPTTHANATSSGRHRNGA